MFDLSANHCLSHRKYRFCREFSPRITAQRYVDAIVERANREGTAEIGAKREQAGDGQPRFYTAAFYTVIRDFTAGARAAGSETSYVCAGTNFLA